jgi:exonuclease SbcC
MIPLKLQVHNFMCYRDDVPPLDLRGIHVACLTGANGHGKSALLDAMTWAIWGKARARRDDELIHQGQTEMAVELEFALVDNTYRVLRKRGGGRSSLELQALDGQEWRVLTEDSIRKTQSRITQLLRMDYDTFINSAFLVQGRADEFTVKPPGERKKVLGEILGLAEYDVYEERAKEFANEKEMEARSLQGQIGEIDRELAHEPEYRREAEQAKAAEAELADKLRLAEEELAALREKSQVLQGKRRQLEELTKSLARDQDDLHETEEQIGATQKRISGYEATLARRQEIEEGHARLVEARAANGEWNERLSRQVGLVERKGELEGQVADARSELTTERRLLADRVEQQSALAQTAQDLQEELAQAREELAQLAQVEARRESLRLELQQAGEEMSALVVRNEQLKAEMDALKEKIALLQEATTANCPLCDQPLTEGDRERLIVTLEAEGREKGDAYRANKTRSQELNGRQETLRGEIKDADQRLAALPSSQGRAATLEKSLAEAQEAAATLSDLQARQEGLDLALEKGDYAPQEQAQLSALLGELAALGYDEAAHQAARETTTEMASFEAEKRELENALSRLDEERKRLEELRTRRERWQDRLAADRQKHKALEEELAAQPEVAARLAEMGQEVDRRQKELGRARLELGAARQRVEACKQRAAERQTLQARLQETQEEQGIYQELRAAFGKKGIQAMIIESAIPEIEDEANRLLARMTDGRMNVRFETQRDTKKGTTIETLDIQIADELGTRNYELYSGGESFRVNFAIRIALSRLLARRAGARLQTLIMDEGFGTQDSQGRERLVEAINSIQEDFEVILVITHIDELRDAFPVRIEVWKTPQGSQFAVR